MAGNCTFDRIRRFGWKSEGTVPTKFVIQISMRATDATLSLGKKASSPPRKIVASPLTRSGNERTTSSQETGTAPIAARRWPAMTISTPASLKSRARLLCRLRLRSAGNCSNGVTSRRPPISCRSRFSNIAWRIEPPKQRISLSLFQSSTPWVMTGRHSSTTTSSLVSART